VGASVPSCQDDISGRVKGEFDLHANDAVWVIPKQVRPVGRQIGLFDDTAGIVL
jgi:hypothetical protein